MQIIGLRSDKVVKLEFLPGDKPPFCDPADSQHTKCSMEMRLNDRTHVLPSHQDSKLSWVGRRELSYFISSLSLNPPATLMQNIEG